MGTATLGKAEQAHLAECQGNKENLSLLVPSGLRLTSYSQVLSGCSGLDRGRTCQIRHTTKVFKSYQGVSRTRGSQSRRDAANLSQVGALLRRKGAITCSNNIEALPTR